MAGVTNVPEGVEKKIPDPPDGISFPTSPSSTWLGLLFDSCNKRLRRVVVAVVLFVVSAVAGELDNCPGFAVVLGVVVNACSWLAFPSVVNNSSTDAGVTVGLVCIFFVVLEFIVVAVDVDDLGLPVVEGNPEEKLTPNGLNETLF